MERKNGLPGNKFMSNQDLEESLDIAEELILWADLIDAAQTKARLIFLSSDFLRTASEEILELRNFINQTMSFIEEHKANDHEFSAWFDKKQELINAYKKLQERFNH